MTAGEINRTEKNLLVYSKLQTEIFFFLKQYSQERQCMGFLTSTEINLWQIKTLLFEPKHRLWKCLNTWLRAAISMLCFIHEYMLRELNACVDTTVPIYT